MLINACKCDETLLDNKFNKLFQIAVKVHFRYYIYIYIYALLKVLHENSACGKEFTHHGCRSRGLIHLVLGRFDLGLQV